MSVTINDAGLTFTSTLTKRSKTTAIVLHHRAGTGDVKSIHTLHLNNGWAGIGYNFYVRLDGTIYKGRGWEYIGAHAGASSGYNSKSIGICFEGNFSELTSMPTIQYNAGVALIKEALNKYSTITEIKGHGEVYATSCPGTNFPLAKMKAVLTAESEDEDLTETTVKVNGTSIGTGYLINNSNYIPVRALVDAMAKALGDSATISWDGNSKTVNIVATSN